MTSLPSMKEEISNNFYLQLDEDFKKKFLKLRKIIVDAYSNHVLEGSNARHLKEEVLLFEENSNTNPDEAVMNFDDFGKKRDQLLLLQEAFFFLGFEVRFTKETTSYFNYKVKVHCKLS